ncbi:MAG TPA: protein kinase, partial [Vicinamibacteria bacterium]|nr:protein kinase [Vicinamibacteria bacterium]
RAEALPSSGPAEWHAGDVVLGLYEVIGPLGQGGMGRVYRVRHRGWGVDLAVKVPLPRALEAAGGAEAFEREAETWVNLPLNPHVVSCYYVRRLEGLPRVFAEYVDGGSLAEAIADGRLRTLDSILDASIQFAWGLHDAHEQGLVHRDVKPGNVMMTMEGVAKVTDFGLASARVAAAAPAAPVAAAGGGTTAMAPGGGGGTPAYMSPEQWTGQPLSRRTDVWSWGLALLEAFLGQRTWQAGPAAPGALEEALAAGPPHGLPAMPPAVVALLRRCFTLDPDQRPRTMAEAADALAATYESELGRPYPRTRPTAGRQTAATLNNRAVSLLDLGRGDADSLWSQALAVEPKHLESTYNQALNSWTEGRLADAELLARVEEAQRAAAGGARGLHLRGTLLLATGDHRRAAETRALALAARAAPPGPELQRDRALALCAQGAHGGGETAWRDALACLEEAVQAGGEQPVDVVAAARARIALGSKDEARRLYAEAAERHGGLPRDLAEAVARHLPGHERRAVLKDLAETAVAVAVVPDGSRVLAASGAATVRTWSTARGQPEAGFSVPELKVKCLAVSADGGTVVVGGEGAPPHLCELPGGRVVRTLQRHPGVTTALALSRDGRLAAGGGTDRAVRVWELASGRCLQVFEGHAEAVACVAIADDGGTVASGGLDGVVRLWDVAGGRPRAALEGHRGRVSALVLDAGRGMLVSGGEDRTVRQWAAASGQPVRVFAGATMAVSALSLSADGQTCAAASLDRSVRVWDLARGRLRSLARLEAPILAAAAAPGAPVLWCSCGTSLHAVRLDTVWRRPPFAVARPVSVTDVQHREAAFHQRLTEARQSLTRGDLAGALKLAREARFVTGHERSAEALALWDDVTSLLPRKGLEAAWELATLEGHRDPVVAVSVGGDGARALSGDLAGQVRAWDLAARAPAAVLEGHEATVSSVALTPDQEWGVSGSWDRTVRLWPLGGGAARVLEGHGDYVNAVAVSPNGRTLLSASSDQTLRLWSLPGGAAGEVLEGHDSQVSACAFGSDGRYALSAGWDATVRVWDLDTHSCVSVLQGHEGSVGTVAVSPDGRQAASGGLDGVVRLWDLRTRRALRTLTGHTAEVTVVAYFLDGRHLVSSSRDKTVRLWDLATGRCLQTLSHTGAVLSAAPLPGGNALLTGGTDLLLRLWRLEWEPEARPLPSWDDKARTHLATLVSIRVPGGAKTVRPADLDTLVQDLRRRGFGGVDRTTVAAQVTELTARPEAVTSAWDEIRAAAPVAHARVAAAQAARRVRRRLPRRQVVMAAAGIVFAVVLGAVLFRPRHAELALSRHQAERARQDLALVSFLGGAACAEPGGYARYVELARDRVVGEDTLACLVKLQQPGLVDAYLSGMQLDDPDPVIATRQRRMAVSLMAALDEPAPAELCRALETGGANARWVAARALAAHGGPAAAACVTEATRHPDAGVRADATSSLRLLVAREAVAPRPAWDAVQPLLSDTDPRVRRQAVRAVAMFGFDEASAALGVLETDADPEVASLARSTLEGLRQFRNFSPDKPY